MGKEVLYGKSAVLRYDLLIKKVTRRYFGHGYEPEDFYQIGVMSFRCGCKI